MEVNLRNSRKRRLILLMLAVFHTTGVVVANGLPETRKRQIYREGVLPSRGGVIPEGAFTQQRLQHNIHDSLGVEAPDGYLFLARETDIRPGRRDPEDEHDLLTLTHQGPLGHTDLSGLTPSRPQPTTYLLRRPASESLYPSQFPRFLDALPRRLSYNEPIGWQVYPTPPRVLFSPFPEFLY